MDPRTHMSDPRRQGHLTVVQGVPLASHFDRLDAARAELLAAFGTMTLDDFRRPRILP